MDQIHLLLKIIFQNSILDCQIKNLTFYSIILFARIGAAVEKSSQPFITKTAPDKLVLIQLSV